MTETTQTSRNDATGTDTGVTSLNPEALEPAPAPLAHQRTQRWQRLTILSWLTLIALLLVWHQRVPTPQPVAALFLALLPLLIPAPWLLRGQRGASLTMAVLALLYFSHAIAALYGRTDETLWALAELLVSCCLFISSTLTARLLR